MQQVRSECNEPASLTVICNNVMLRCETVLCRSISCIVLFACSWISHYPKGYSAGRVSGQRSTPLPSLMRN